MPNLKTSYLLEGDDQTPRAYLEAVRDLLTEHIDEKEGQKERAATQIEKRSLRGEADGLMVARRLVESVILGLECEHGSV